MSLSELVVNDDLDISMDPETYQDQANPAPPLPGNYTLVITAGDGKTPTLTPRKNKAGELILVDDKFPILTAMRAKIVEPEEAAKEFSLFHDIRTKPFDRFGSVVSDVGDLIRGMDQTRGYTGLADGLSVLEELVAQSTPFRVKLTWEAYDGEFVAQEFDRLGVTKDNAKERLAKEVYNGIYKKARLKATDFPADGKGGRQQVATGPSGTKLEARAKITQVFPSAATVNLGQFKVK